MEQKSRKPAPKRPATQKQSAPAERTMKQTVIRHLNRYGIGIVVMSLVGQPCGKASSESLEGKPQIP